MDSFLVPGDWYAVEGPFDFIVPAEKPGYRQCSLFNAGTHAPGGSNAVDGADFKFKIRRCAAGIHEIVAGFFGTAKIRWLRQS